MHMTGNIGTPFHKEIRKQGEKPRPCLVLKKFCKINPLRVEERVSPDSLRESFPYLACAEN